MLNEEITKEIFNSDLSGKFLTFWVEDQIFGVPISDVVSIVGIQKITPIPDYPDYAPGVIDLRGTIISLIDMGAKLNDKPIEIKERTCIVVTKINGNQIGFIVGGVEEVSDITNYKVSKPPKVSEDYKSEYLSGIGHYGEKLVLFVDTKKLLTKSELERIIDIEV